MKIIVSVLAVLTSSPAAEALAETSQQDQVVTATAKASSEFECLQRVRRSGLQSLHGARLLQHHGCKLHLHSKGHHRRADMGMRRHRDVQEVD